MKNTDSNQFYHDIINNDELLGFSSRSNSPPVMLFDQSQEFQVINDAIQNDDINFTNDNVYHMAIDTALQKKSLFIHLQPT